MTSILKTGLKAAIALALLAAAGWTVWNWTASRRLERVLEEIRADGLPTRFADLPDALLPHQGRPADGENAAYLYRAAAFELRMVAIPSKVWDEAAKSLPAVPDRLRRRLTDCDEVCDTLHRAARLPRCRFELRWSDGFAMELPHLLEMRQLSRLLAARSVVRADGGNLEGAVADLHALFALSRAFREEPILISQIVRITCAGVGMSSVKHILPASPTPVAMLEEIDPDAAFGAAQFGLKGELVGMVRLADPHHGFPTPSTPRLTWSFLYTVGRPYIRSDLAFLCENGRRVVEAAGQPYPVAIDRAHEIDRELESGGVITRLYSVRHASQIQMEARHASRVALARVAARCLEYRQAHGTFPASLEKLGGDFTDPLTGSPFLLEPSGDRGIVLRSDGDDEVRWELERP